MAEYIWLNHFAVQQKLIQIVKQLYFNKKFKINKKELASSDQETSS